MTYDISILDNKVLIYFQSNFLMQAEFTKYINNEKIYVFKMYGGKWLFISDQLGFYHGGSEIENVYKSSKSIGTFGFTVKDRWNNTKTKLFSDGFIMYPSFGNFGMKLENNFDPDFVSSKFTDDKSCIYIVIHNGRILEEYS